MIYESITNNLHAVMISVIVPVYQVEELLPRCLDSIAAQTYTDYELILVNDGSPDRSDVIMEKYASQDARIRLIYKENGGLSSARNAGLDIATGKYIIFIDSDDFVEPTLFEDAVRAAEESGADQVLWNYIKFSDQWECPPRLNFEDEIIDVDSIGLTAYFYKYWFPYRHGQESVTKLYLRRIIEENNLRFQPNREIFAEDTLFTTMYLMHSHKIAALNKAYYYYYQHSGSIMNSPKPKVAHRLMTLAVRLCEYVQVLGKDKELKNVLPILCYNLCCRGIRNDANPQDVLAALAEYRNNHTMRRMMWRLISPMPLLHYTSNTTVGRRHHIWARMFALRWLCGDNQGVAALVQRTGR